MTRGPVPWRVCTVRASGRSTGFPSLMVGSVVLSGAADATGNAPLPRNAVSTASILNGPARRAEPHPNGTAPRDAPVHWRRSQLSTSLRAWSLA